MGSLLKHEIFKNEIFKNYKEGVQRCMSSWGKREEILHDFFVPTSH